MPLLHGAFELEWVDPFIDGIPGWGGLASPAVDWYDSHRPRVFTSSESEPGTVGVCMNNAWYAASTEGGTYAVFAEATGEYRVHLAQWIYLSVRQPGGAWSWPNGGASIRIRYSTDLGVGAWSGEVEVCPFVESDLSVTQGTQNFASLSIDDVSGRCLVCWEDTDGGVTENIATSNGAVADLADLTSWTSLGILTGHPVPTNSEPSELEIKAESTRYPCVVANMGHPQVFYRAVNGKAELVFRAGRWA